MVTVEIEQSLLVGPRSNPARFWCAACVAEIQAVAPEDADSSKVARMIRRCAEEGMVHSTEKPSVELQLCHPSLLACALVRRCEI